MSLFNRLFGYPDGDPSGRDRGLFRKVGSQAAQAFIAEQNPTKAAEIVERFAESVNRQCGEFHPDIGRSTLLSAVFLTTMAKYDAALQAAECAEAVLTPLGPNDYDYRTAEFLAEKLRQVCAGTWDKSEGPIIAPGTPAGDFLYDLKA